MREPLGGERGAAAMKGQSEGKNCDQPASKAEKVQDRENGLKSFMGKETNDREKGTAATKGPFGGNQKVPRKTKKARKKGQERLAKKRLWLWGKVGAAT